MSPPPSASSPRAPRVDGRARENRHECIIGTHARARSTSRRIASTEACARFFLFHPIASALARVNGRSNARARGFVGSRPRIDPVDVPRVARRSRRATNARVGGIRARRFCRSFRRRFALAPRSRARGRRFDSIRFDSIDSRPGRVFISFFQARFGRTSSFARESGESRRRTPHHSVPLKDLADRSRGA